MFAFLAWVPWVVLEASFMRHHHILVWGLVGSVGKAFGILGSGRAKRCGLFVGVSRVRRGSGRFQVLFLGKVAGWVFDQLVVHFGPVLGAVLLLCGIGVWSGGGFGCSAFPPPPRALLTFGLFRLWLWRRRGVFVCQDTKRASKQSERAGCGYGN